MINKKLLMLLTSVSLLVPTLASASVKDNDITTVNINEVNDVVISPKVANMHKSNISLRDVHFKNMGFSMDNLTIKPRIVFLDSCTVPDGEGVCNSATKTYMAYTAVTCKSSPQYKLLRSPEAHTDEVTGLRMVGDRICIAMGTFYASEIGTKINLVMANGSTVKCILGDIKSDMHTDPTHRYQRWDGSVAEMIVDYDYFSSTKQYPKELDGKIARVDIVK